VHSKISKILAKSSTSIGSTLRVRRALDLKSQESCCTRAGTGINQGWSVEIGEAYGHDGSDDG